MTDNDKLSDSQKRIMEMVDDRFHEETDTEDSDKKSEENLEEGTLGRGIEQLSRRTGSFGAKGAFVAIKRLIPQLEQNAMVWRAFRMAAKRPFTTAQEFLELLDKNMKMNTSGEERWVGQAQQQQQSEE